MHIRMLTGHGFESDLLCRACDQAAAEDRKIELVVACEGCVARCTGDDWSGVAGWRGTPGIVDRAQPLDTAVVDVRLPVAVVDLCPVAASGSSIWLLLADDGTIGRFDADLGDWVVLARCTVPDEPERRPWTGHRLRRRLHASADGRYAAVVNDFGRHGQVLDLASGTVTMTLDGGDSHAETVPLSCGFVEHNGRALIVHRTHWNRVDVSEPGTGLLVTERPLLRRRSLDDPRPDHYLDYFHGALHVSPGCHRIADDGWVWHPVGIPVTWDLRTWLGGNVWESEDGPTRIDLCDRDYHWNVPMCWLDDERLAVSGIGGDDQAMLAGVRVFNATTGAELAAFAGPSGELFADRTRLYAADLDGLTIWDPLSGERVGRVPGFVSTHHHPGAGELVVANGPVLRRWRMPM